MSSRVSCQEERDGVYPECNARLQVEWGRTIRARMAAASGTDLAVVAHRLTFFLRDFFGSVFAMLSG